MNDTVKKKIKKNLTDRPTISNFPLEGNITFFCCWPNGDADIKFYWRDLMTDLGRDQLPGATVDVMINVITIPNVIVVSK